MNAFDVTLAARAYHEGRAVRSAAVRHRLLIERPLVVSAWQLGAEPFSVAALGWGTRPDVLTVAVAGDPRNRDLLFTALRPFAATFNAWFETAAETLEATGSGMSCATTAPQVVVANRATADLLGRLGRRLAYLPTVGERPADPALIRLGRHLLFLHDHAATPGQQVLVALTDLVGGHWATAQSAVERQSLGALDAWIDPPAGRSAFEAAEVAEWCSVGPLPAGEAEEQLGPLVERFNRLRNGRTDAASVRPLLDPVRAFYQPLVADAWELMWRCLERECGYPEGRSVARRWREDRAAYTWHVDRLHQDGRRRTRQTGRQAARTLHRLEQAADRLGAEEACDDSLRLAPLVLDEQAVCGRVVRVDSNYRERVRVNTVRRPLVTLHSARPCRMPAGKELKWTEALAGPDYRVQAVASRPDGGSEVTLVALTSKAERCPAVGSEAAFLAFSGQIGYVTPLPEVAPWTHQPGTPLPDPCPIED